MLQETAQINRLREPFALSVLSLFFVYKLQSPCRILPRCYRELLATACQAEPDAILDSRSDCQAWSALPLHEFSSRKTPAKE